MAESQILDWLNENRYRAYPLQYGEVIISASESSIEIVDGKLKLKGDDGNWYWVQAYTDEFGNTSVAVDQTPAPEGSVGAAESIVLVSTDDQNYRIHVVVIEGEAVVGIEQTPVEESGLAQIVLISTDDNSYALKAITDEGSTYIGFDQTPTTDTNDFGVVTSNKNLESLILDACLVFTTTVPSPVNLISVVVGTNYIISVTGQSSFTVLDAANAEYPYYVRNTQGSLLVIGESIKEIESNSTFNVPFEPTVCYEFSSEWSGVDSISFNNSAPLSGEITFSEGYQFGIDVSGSNISLSADKSRGNPVDCSKFFPGYVPDDCSNIISYINGVGVINNGDDFSLSAGSHIAIYPDKENHRIYIGLNFDDPSQDICPAIIPNPIST